MLMSNRKEVIMEEVFKKFIGCKISVTILNSMGMTIDKVGYLEIEDDWAYLYDKGKSGSNYNVAINLNKNNVISIRTLDRR